MEASQQQRRPTIGQFAQTLADAKLDFDAIDLADMLWLAQFVESDASPQPVPLSPPPSPPSLPPSSNRNDTDESSFNVYPEDSPPLPEPSKQESAESPAEQPQGTPFSVPAAPALRTRLDLARSLRPLMRKVPSRTRFELDETATVTQIAETEVWLPVVRPTPERWLELDLVVESSKTTVIWERAIAELNHLVEYQGAFRAVRTWQLSVTTDRVQLFSRWREGVTKGAVQAYSQQGSRPHTPSELIDPTGRRLIWFVTDCTSPLWQHGLIYQVLQKWAAVQPIAIVQLFPSSLWKRTALRNGYQVNLSALAPGLPSALLKVDGLPTRLERRGRADQVTLPIVSLNADAMRNWARVIAGLGDSRVPGRTFDLALVQRQAVKNNLSTTGAAAQLTAQERVDFFRATTRSETVKHLANLMAATPVSLPVVDLLREAFRADFQEEVRQSHVAQVLLSGLLRRCDTPEEEVCRYEFIGDDAANSHERVRDILLGDASITKTLEVLDVLSESICRKMNSPVKSFQALLSELEASDTDELRAAALPFARVGVSVLRRLGGVHADIARRYDPEIRGNQTIESRDWLADFDLQPLTYEVTEYLNFPPLTDFNFTDAELTEDTDFPPPLQTKEFTIIDLQLASDTEPTEGLTEELERFNFKVATVVRQGKQRVIRQRQGSAHRYVEKLSEAIDLEMVLVPGGTFVMGSPEDEPERSDRESPQHEVTLEPFFMGRYPVTQAQWRAVAGFPQVNRSLNTNPSRFKGDRLPVERVSWYDAVEFCARLSRFAENRLSAYTGRQYRLPSEAEWEYACRAKTTTPFHFGDMILAEVANFNGKYAYADGPKGEYRKKTTPVDHFGIANDFGLSDMHCNVWEWCQDNWYETYADAPTDGSAWVEDGTTSRRVRRGGSWSDYPSNCRSASRSELYPDFVNIDFIGFRVVCTASWKQATASGSLP